MEMRAQETEQETEKVGQPAEGTARPGAPAARRLLSRRLLSLGLVLALLLGAGGYFYLAADRGRGDIPEPRTAQAPAGTAKDASVNAPPDPARSAPEPMRAQREASTSVPEPAQRAPTPSDPPGSPNQSTVEPVARNLSAETSADSQRTPTTPAPADAATREAADGVKERPASLPTGEVVFVQSTKARIRSEPSLKARVVGSAVKGRQFKVVRRAGSWAQVEGDDGQGWISSTLLGPRAP
jgi:cytoskeletal protein RodZ